MHIGIVSYDYDPPIGGLGIVAKHPGFGLFAAAAAASTASGRSELRLITGVMLGAILFISAGIIYLQVYSFKWNEGASKLSGLKGSSP